MSNVIVCDHPLVQHKISLLRDKNTAVSYTHLTLPTTERV